MEAVLERSEVGWVPRVNIPLNPPSKGDFGTRCSEMNTSMALDAPLSLAFAGAQWAAATAASRFPKVPLEVRDLQF